MALCDDSHANDATYVPAWRIGYLVHHHCSLPVQWIHGIKCCLATAPTCSTTEITRSTLTLNNPFGWVEWDLTSLAQSNIANGNTTMTFMLAMIGSTGSSHSFYSSEYSDDAYHPHLVLDYVDNVNGIVPPGQPMLTSPADGQVLYAEADGLLTPRPNPS